MFISSGYRAQTRSSRPGGLVTSPSGTGDHHLAARVVLGGRDRGPACALEPGFGALALELRRKHAGELDCVRLHGPAPVGRDRLPPALEYKSITVRPDGRGVAGVDHAVALAHVRHQPGASVRKVVRLKLAGDRRRQYPTAVQVPAGPLQEGTPPLLTTQQLDGLHRHETGREPLLELERPGVCEHGGNIEPVGPARELRE